MREHVHRSEICRIRAREVKLLSGEILIIGGNNSRSPGYAYRPLQVSSGNTGLDAQERSGDEWRLERVNERTRISSYVVSDFYGGHHRGRFSSKRARELWKSRKSGNDVVPRRRGTRRKCCDSAFPQRGRLAAAAEMDRN